MWIDTNDEDSLAKPKGKGHVELRASAKKWADKKQQTINPQPLTEKEK